MHRGLLACWGTERRCSRFSLLLLTVCVAVCLGLHTGAQASGALDAEEAAWALSIGTKEALITHWEEEVSTLRRDRLAPLLAKAQGIESELREAQKKRGFFYTNPDDKAMIDLLDEDYRRALVRVTEAEREEALLVARLKPLYGVLSVQHYQEQRATMLDALATVREASYNSAWYDSLFRIGEAESVSDLIIGFLLQWFIGYIVMYPFALAYYALWAAPRTLYAYSSSVTDILPALGVYLAGVLAMTLPLVALFGGFVWVAKHLAANAHRERRYRR